MAKRKRTKEQTTIYKTLQKIMICKALHRKLMIDQHDQYSRRISVTDFSRSNLRSLLIFAHATDFFSHKWTCPSKGVTKFDGTLQYLNRTNRSRIMYSAPYKCITSSTFILHCLLFWKKKSRCLYFEPD
jgi:hypothetical protein